MLVTRYFVFVHLPKTGGDFVRKVLEGHLPDRWFIDVDVAKHGSLRDLDDLSRSYAADTPRFAAVRDPWDWHVSWFHYLMGTGRPREHQDRVREMNPFFVKASDDFTNDFGTTMWNIYGDADAFDDAAMVADLREQDIDMLTWHYRRQLGDEVADPLVTVGRAESLRSDLLRFLESTRAPLSSSLADALKTSDRVNRSKRDPYPTYYDDTLRAEIGRRASSIIDAFGYEFGGKDTVAQRADREPAAVGTSGGRD